MSVAPESDAGQLLVVLADLEGEAGLENPGPEAVNWAKERGWSPDRFMTAIFALKEQGLVDVRPAP
jgi:hypothetical protein